MIYVKQHVYYGRSIAPATENNDGRLKTHSSIARLVINIFNLLLFFFFKSIINKITANIIRASENRSGQVKVLSPLAWMATAIIWIFQRNLMLFYVIRKYLYAECFLS